MQDKIRWGLEGLSSRVRPVLRNAYTSIVNLKTTLMTRCANDSPSPRKKSSVIVDDEEIYASIDDTALEAYSEYR